MNLMLPQLLAICSVLISAPCVIAQGEIPTEVIRLTVKKKPTLEGAKSFGDGGVTLKVLALLAGKAVIGLDKDASKIESWTDDKGTDLKAGAPTGFFYWASLSHRFGSDKSDVWGFEIKTKTLPDAKAERMKLDAKVVLLAAAGEEKVKGELILKKGSKVPNAPVPMKVSEVKKGFSGKWEVTFESNSKMDAIKSVQFFSTDGKPIKTKSAGSSSMGFGKKYTYHKSYSLARKVDKALVELTLHKGVEKVTIPLKLDLGLGF